MFNDNDDQRANRKPLMFYVLIAMTVILVLNTFVFPLLVTRQVEAVAYSDFLSWVDEGRVKEVSLSQESDQITFLATNEEGREQIYKTAVFPDDGLIARLQ